MDTERPTTPASSLPPSGARHTIQEGSKIILEMNDDKHIFVVVRGRNRIKLGRSYCPVQPLIGCPYGSTFGLAPDGRSLQQIPHSVPADWLAGAATEVTKDNSQLVDAGEVHQKLTSEAIAEMKCKGSDGNAIVDALAEHSATFASKTEFAQAKYKKKKAKKYIVRAVARRATAAAIAQVYFLRQPARIGHLRLDTLSLLLSLANIGAGARALIVDGCGGLVLGAVAERLGGTGAVQGVFFGAKPPSREALTQFDSPHMVVEQSADTILTEHKRRQKIRSIKEADIEGEIVSRDAGENRSIIEEDANKRAATNCEHAQFTCCILAAPTLDPGSTLHTLLPLLAPSSAFAIYSPWQQPLAETMHALRAQHAAVNLTLQESWWRMAQVLPSRTHPTMQMNHGGGFVLSGTTVVRV